MPEPLLSTLPVLSHLIFVAVIKGRCCYPSRFSDKGIKSMSLKSRCRAHSRALTKARWTLEPCPWSLTTLAPRSPCSAGTSQRMLSNIRLPASFQGGLFGPDSLDLHLVSKCPFLLCLYGNDSFLSRTHLCLLPASCTLDFSWVRF